MGLGSRPSLCNYCLLSKPKFVSQSFRSKQKKTQHLKCFLSHLMSIVKVGPFEMITTPINDVKLMIIMECTLHFSFQYWQWNSTYNSHSDIRRKGYSEIEVGWCLWWPWWHRFLQELYIWIPTKPSGDWHAVDKRF